MLVAQVSDGKLQLGGFLDKYKVNADEYKEIGKRLPKQSKVVTTTPSPTSKPLMTETV